MAAALNGGQYFIPLPANISNTHEDERINKVRKALTTGGSCSESMREMWRTLKLLTPFPTNTDETDGNAPSTIHSAGQTNTKSNEPSTSIMQDELESKILASFCDQLFLKIPDSNPKELLICRAIQKKPLLLKTFLQMLSGFITFVYSANENTGEATIQIQLGKFIRKSGTGGIQETSVLLNLLRGMKNSAVRNKILSHPVITTIATLKYKKYRYFAVGLIIYHLVFALLFTYLSFVTFPVRNRDNFEWLLFAKKYSTNLLVFMALVNIGMSTASFVILQKIPADIKTTRKLGQLLSSAAIIFIYVPFHFGYQVFGPCINKDITAFAVMFSWFVLLSYLTKFNQTAVYVETFFQIVTNYFRFLGMMALCQIIALTSAYVLIFHQIKEDNFEPLANIPGPFIRVLTGRMNYEDFTSGRIEFENPFSIFTYFFIFLIFTTVMMSMIIGLATNDLKETRTASARNVLCQVIQDIAELEWIISKIFCGRMQAWAREKISITCFLKEGTVFEVQPHNLEDNKIPESLKLLIYNDLIKRGKTCPKY